MHVRVLAGGLNFQASMWHFLKLIDRGFLRVLWFPSLLHRFNGSANKIKLNKCNLNSVKHNSLSCLFVPCGTQLNMLHVISTQCDLHTTAPRPIFSLHRKLSKGPGTRCNFRLLQPAIPGLQQSQASLQQTRRACRQFAGRKGEFLSLQESCSVVANHNAAFRMTR